MSELVVRAVCADDRVVWSQLWNAYLEFYETKRASAQHDVTWDRILGDNVPMYSVIAEHRGRPVGLANYLFHPGFWDADDMCYLNDLYVEPTTRGAGAGAALIEAVAAHAKRRGTAEFYWLTAESNATARRLYDHVAECSGFVHYVKPL